MTASDHLTRIADGTLDRTVTPHSDAARLAMADFKAKLAHRVILPGADGARARMQIEVIGAAQLSIGKELDGGLPESVVAMCLVDAIASLVSSHVMKFVFDQPTEQRLWLVEEFSKSIADKARKRVLDIDKLPADQIAGIITSRPKQPGRA